MPKLINVSFQDTPHRVRHIGSSTKVVLLLKNQSMQSLMNLHKISLKNQKKKKKLITILKIIMITKTNKLGQTMKKKMTRMKITQNLQILAFLEIRGMSIVILKTKSQVTQVKMLELNLHLRTLTTTQPLYLKSNQNLQKRLNVIQTG